MLWPQHHPVIQNDDPAGSTRDEAHDFRFEAAIGDVYREQRVTLPVLTFLADVDKGNFAAIRQPVPDGVDFYEFCHANPAIVRTAGSQAAAGVAIDRRTKTPWTSFR